MADPTPVRPYDAGTLADAIEQRRDPTPIRPAQQPAELDEIFEAARTYARPDRMDSESLRLTRGFEPILEALNAGKPKDQQYVDPGLWIRLGGNLDSSSGMLVRRGSRQETWDPRTWARERVTVRQQMELIFSEVRERRAKDPAFLPGIPSTWQEYRKQLLERDKAERAEAGGVLARSPGGLIAGAVGFAGGAREIIADPINIASLPLGGGVGSAKSLTAIAFREALINAGLEAIQQPQVAENRALLDEELTAGEAAFNIGTAGAFGGAFPVAIAGAGKVAKGIAGGYDWTVGRVFAAMPESVQAKWAAKMKVGDQPIGEFFGTLSHGEAADLARDMIGGGNLSPEQRAMITALEGQDAVATSSPFRPGVAGDAEHGQRLSVAIQDIIDQNRPPIGGSPSGAPAVGGSAAASVADAAGAPLRPGEASTVARPQSIAGRALERGRAAWDAVKAKIARPESGGVDRITNRAGSSASGRYQFIESTFKSLWKRVYGGGADAAWRNRRFDRDVQERLMDALLEENATILERAGIQATTGNLYLAHFAGADRAANLLKADPSAPVSRFFSEKEIEQNKGYLGGGKSVSEAIAVIYGKVGGAADSVPARGGGAGGIDVGDDPRIAQLRDEAQRLNEIAIGETPLASGGALPAMRSIAVDPRSIAVDAERFQFKSGGDAFGVTERLRGVTEWNPVYAGRVVIWEDASGKLFIADGHQRLGLARRIQDESGQEIKLEGILMRESDGVTAEDARTWAALKNIAEGTGTATDAAKVIRQVGAEVLEHLPPKSALVRDGAALSRLSDEAFGAVYNEVIAPDIAAVVGHLAPDNPAAHAGLIDLLVQLDPPNRGQAESIVRQAIAAGFHKAEQVELFGTREITSSLFLERAKVLERGLASLRKLKGVFGVASKNADALEGAGSKIARSKAEQEAARNAEAIEIVSRLAFSKGPVADALNAAAERLAGGAKLGDVVADFVGAVRALELGDLNRAGAGDSGRLAPDGAGRGGDARAEGDELPSEPADQGQPSLLELERATERFSDPDGPATQEQVESLIHDFKGAIDDERLIGASEDDWLASLSDREIADIFTAEVLDEQLNALALRQGRELELVDDPAAFDALAELAMGPLAGERDKLAKEIDKAFADGRLKTRDLGEPELVEPEIRPPSEVVPAPEKPMKSAEYAGSYIAPAEASARVAQWKAEAQRIGRENPPPPGSVILSLFDASGAISRPYREMGYEVIQLDAKNGHDLLRNLNHYLNAIEEVRARGGKIRGVLAQPPCTTFAGSGARWWDPRHNRNWGNAVEKMWGKWATKFFKSPVEYNQFLVAATEEFIAKSAPDFFLIENPRGRIAKLNGLPKPLLTIEPHHFGDPYTKNTSLFGKFNAELPTANVDPVEGSRMHKLRSSAEKDDGLRSLTPEGFAYAFALANRPGTEASAAARQSTRSAKPGTRPSDEQLLAVMPELDNMIGGGPAASFARMIRELGERTGIAIDETNVGRFADELAAIEGKNGGFMHAAVEEWIASHMGAAGAARPAPLEAATAALKRELEGVTDPDEIARIEAIGERIDAIAAADAGKAAELPIDNAVTQWRAKETNAATGHFSPADADAAIELGRLIAQADGKAKVERVHVLEAAAYVDQLRRATREIEAQANQGGLDLGPAVDPNAAARDAKALELGAAAPLRGENATGVAQDGTIGLDLFDAADQPGLDFGSLTFRLGEEGDEIRAADVLAELEADDAAIAEIKGCL